MWWLYALTTYYNDLKAKNAAVIAASAPLSNARITRNDIMYKDTTGLCDIAIDVKSYIKSLYGASSPQYKQISSLKFTKVRWFNKIRSFIYNTEACNLKTTSRIYKWMTFLYKTNTLFYTLTSVLLFCASVLYKKITCLYKTTTCQFK